MQVCSRELAASLFLLVFILIHYIELMWHKNVMHFTEKTVNIYSEIRSCMYPEMRESLLVSILAFQAAIKETL